MAQNGHCIENNNVHAIQNKTSKKPELIFFRLEIQIDFLFKNNKQPTKNYQTLSTDKLNSSYDNSNTFSFLTLSTLGNFTSFFLFSAVFWSKIEFFLQIFRNINSVSNRLDPDQAKILSPNYRVISR